MGWQIYNWCLLLLLKIRVRPATQAGQMNSGRLTPPWIIRIHKIFYVKSYGMSLKIVKLNP